MSYKGFLRNVEHFSMAFLRGIHYFLLETSTEYSPMTSLWLKVLVKRFINTNTSLPTTNLTNLPNTNLTYYQPHQPTKSQSHLYYQPHQPTKYQAHQLPITNPYWLDHFPYQLPTSRFEFRILDPETSELFDLALNVLVESTLQTPHDDVVSV